MVSRRIYLVRHGETEGESSIRYHGRNDVALSDIGRKQVELLIPWLREQRFAAVLHSPLSRARTSAELLIAGLQHPPALVEEHPGLTEIHFGEIEGLTKEEVAERMPEWHAEWEAERIDGFPGGDTLAGFQQRVAEAWDDLVSRHDEGDLLVVAHRGVIKYALTHAMNLDEGQSSVLDIRLASLTVVAIGERIEIEQLGWLPSPE